MCMRPILKNKVNHQRQDSGYVEKTPLTRVTFSPLLQLGAQPLTSPTAQYMGENPIQVLIYVLAVYVLHLYRANYRKRTAYAESDKPALDLQPARICLCLCRYGGLVILA